MIRVHRLLLACATGLLLAPLGAAAQDRAQPEPAPPASETAPPQPEGDTAKDKAEQEDKRICRSVRADPSSRRKTKVCRTLEEWRHLNIPL
jgi:hypothetical protein